MVFNTAPDYESPGDSGADNVYELQVSVSDGLQMASINLSIAVTDMNEDISVGNIFNSFLSDWTDLSNSQSIGSFFGVAIGPDTIVACGIDGLIATRDNSTGTWSITNSGGDSDFRDVIYANGKFVAIGESGMVLTSMDGTSWTTQNSQVSNDLRNIMWDGNKFIVGASSGVILHSMDGSSWTNYNTGSSIEFNAIAYSGSTYIAVGGYGMIYSTDGVNWHSPSSPPASFSMECAAWVGDRFLVSGLNNDIYQSTDGHNWSVALNHSYGFTESIASYNGKTYIVGGSNFILEYNSQTGSFLDANTPLDGSNSLMDVTINGPNVVVVGFNHVVLGKSLDFTNDAPTDLNSTALLTIAENQSIGSTVGIFTASDADANPGLTYQLVSGVGDSDNSLFTLESNGSLLSAQIFDYESNSSTYSIRVQVRDEYNASLEAQFSVSLQNTNEAPTITSASSFSKVENQSMVTTVTATDPEGDTPLFSIVGGADESLFSIGSTSGQLSFASAPNFESPEDANLDNLYEVQVQAIDPSGLLDTQSLTVQVTNANEVPVISSGSSFSLVENGTAVTTVTASDPDVADTITFSISGADASLFNIAQNGELVFTLAPDFEIPSDANSDNHYELMVEVEDGGGLSVTQNLSVQVTDENEAPVITSASNFSIVENTSTVTTLTASDPDGDALTYSINGGADAALFAITNNGELSFLIAPDYENPADADADNLYQVEVRANDLNGLYTAQNLIISVTDILDNQAPVDLNHTSPLEVYENQTIGSLVGEFNATDPDGDPLSFFLVSGTGDSHNGNFILDSNGTLTTAVSFDYESGASRSIRVEVRDNQNASTSGNFLVMIGDLDEVLPVIHLNGSANPVVEAGNTSQDPGANWTDNFDGSGSLIGVGTVDSNTPGTYFLNFDYSDLAGNPAVTQTRTISVVDSTAPVISLNEAGTISVVAGSFYQDPGAVWTDEVDGNGNLDGTGLVNTLVPGSYSIEYDFSDNAGNSASTVIRTVMVTNENPSGISLSYSYIAENQPSGTLVGELSGVDPDGPLQNLSFAIVSDPEGDGVPFEINQQNELRTLQNLDFEQVSAYSLSIQVSDPYGGNFEQDFEIEVTDQFSPIVETESPVLEESGRIRLSGRIVDPGSSMENLEVGFFIGSEPVGDGMGNGLEEIFLNLDSAGRFSGYYYPDSPGTLKYIVAFGKNQEGMGLGLEEKITISRETSLHAWAQAEALPETPSWSESSWFGTYYTPSDSSWIMHLGLGWLYPMPSSQNGVWLWGEDFGWLWTDQAVYPYLYRHLSDGWMYFYGSSQNRALFYDYKLENWISVEDLDSSGQDMNMENNL